MYHLTGVCLAESALIISREKTHAHELGKSLVSILSPCRGLGWLLPSPTACLHSAYAEEAEMAAVEPFAKRSVRSIQGSGLMLRVIHLLIEPNDFRRWHLDSRHAGTIVLGSIAESWVRG